MKKISFLLGLIALLAILASCTPAGAEIGLVGKWERNNSLLTTTLELKNDDSVSVEVGPTSYSGKVTIADSAAKTITVKMDNMNNQIISTYYLSTDGKTLIISDSLLFDGEYSKK